MGREHKSDISMNSAYLETFRRRKNEQLASEIDLTQGERSVSTGFRSANSVYLDTFRKRKNRQLAVELNMHEDKSARSDNAASAMPRSRNQIQESSTLALSDGSVGNTVSPDLPMNSLSDGRRVSDNAGRSRNNRFSRSPAVHGNEAHDNQLAGMNQERLGRTRDSANLFAENIDFENGSGSLQHTGANRDALPSPTSSGKVKSGARTGSGAASAQKKDNAHKKDKKSASKKNAKVTILLCVLIVIVCGFVVFTKMNSDSVVDNDDGNSSYSQGITYSTVSQRTDTTDTTTTTTTAESTTESSVETTTTSQTTHYEALSPGQEGDEVLKMQKRLAELGYISKKSCTGFYGDYTKKMIKMFQEKAGLKQTGTADSETLAKLYADDAPDCFS